MRCLLPFRRFDASSAFFLRGRLGFASSSTVGTIREHHRQLFHADLFERMETIFEMPSCCVTP
jgi:hypothetical protein